MNLAKIVLLAEDNTLNRLACNQILSAMGFHVVNSSSGSEAIAQLRSDAHPFVLLLTDFRMPGANGNEVIKTARAKSSVIKTILMTGESDEVIREIAKDCAPDSVIIKPFDIKVLRSTVTRLVPA